MVSKTLLQTAVEQFARLGFEGASTREIARASGTAMSSITYHFGGKEGLYLAAADHIAESISVFLVPVLEAALAHGLQSPEAARDAVLRILDHMAAMMISPQSEDWARFIIREQQAPTEAFDRIYRGLMTHVVDALMTLLRIARPDLGDLELRAMGILMVGQAMVLRAGRAAILRALDIEAIDADHAALLRARLRTNLLCILSEKPE